MIAPGALAMSTQRNLQCVAGQEDRCKKRLDQIQSHFSSEVSGGETNVKPEAGKQEVKKIDWWNPETNGMLVLMPLACLAGLLIVDNFVAK